MAPPRRDEMINSLKTVRKRLLASDIEAVLENGERSFLLEGEQLNWVVDALRALYGDKRYDSSRVPR